MPREANTATAANADGLTVTEAFMQKHHMKTITTSCPPYQKHYGGRLPPVFGLLLEVQIRPCWFWPKSQNGLSWVQNPLFNGLKIGPEAF